MNDHSVVIFGIDAMDSVLLSKFVDDLPNLKRLKEESPPIKARGIFPPDTPISWATIYTGLNPAQHGIVNFVDPLEKISAMSMGSIDSTPIRGKTFWDIAGKYDKKVCVLLPQLGYPVWPVNGIMIGRTTEMYRKVEPVQVYPSSLSGSLNLGALRGIKAVPKQKLLPKYIEAHRKLVLAEAEIGLKLLRDSEWNIFFIYSSSLDWLGHNLWMYFDKNDPSYPGPNPFQGVFKEFYILYDKIIGEFMGSLDPNTTLIVMSDHGFCMRPQKIVNINEILRRMGLLFPKMKRRDASNPYYILERLKRSFANFVNKYGAGKLLMRIVHTLPTLREIYTRPPSIDWEKTHAYVSDLSGIKSYSHGGIIINKITLNKYYESLRTLIINKLTDIKGPTNQTLFSWICRREDLYSGEHITKYPDIVFELKSDYGAGWTIYDSVISTSYVHSIQSGSHRIDTPVFLISNLEKKVFIKKKLELMDVAPTILSLVGIKERFNFDGSSILKNSC